MFRKVPPVAFPINLSDFGNMLRNMIDAEKVNDALVAFERAFAETFNLSRCYAVSSGRSALTIGLKALKEIMPSKTDVIIPSYTCPTVPLSVARAGLKVKLCDISLKTLNIDISSLERLIDENTLCVIAVHMFGFPCDMEKILKIVNANGIFLIEDVAQAAGAKWKGHMLGGLGHLSFFSLGRGKTFTTYEGGVLSIGNAQEPLRKHVESLVCSLRKPNTLHSIRIFAQLLGMSFLQGESAWWFISKLPLGFEKQYHTIDFKMERLSNLQAAFGLSVLERLNFINAIRVSNGRFLTQQLQDLKGIVVPQALEGAQPVYLRLPVVVKDKQLREEIYRELHKAGIGVSKMYVSSLNRYDYLVDIVPDGNYPVAEYVADRIIALPTHPYVTEEDLRLIVKIFRKVIKGGRG